jgi:hypothetical protein
MRRKRRIILFAGLLPLFFVILYLGLLFYAHGFHPRFLDVDRCLDSGGKWNYEKNACEKNASRP